MEGWQAGIGLQLYIVKMPRSWLMITYLTASKLCFIITIIEMASHRVVQISIIISNLLNCAIFCCVKGVNVGDAFKCPYPVGMLNTLTHISISLCWFNIELLPNIACTALTVQFPVYPVLASSVVRWQNITCLASLLGFDIVSRKTFLKGTNKQISIISQFMHLSPHTLITGKLQAETTK